jgi:FMN phosphatase YigB (HAD superfamily)
VVTSEEAGKDKADKRTFELALMKHQVDPDNVWMIGDNPISDILVGNNIGMTTLQKTHSGIEATNNSAEKPDLTFNSYNELLSL